MAALEPYKDAAAASFNTVILSISLGERVDNKFPGLYPPLLECKLPEATGIPSITNKGDFDAEKEPIPLIRISVAEPGCPLTLATCTPGIPVASAFSKEVTGCRDKFSTLATEAEPVNASLEVVP